MGTNECPVPVFNVGILQMTSGAVNAVTATMSGVIYLSGCNGLQGAQLWYKSFSGTPTKLANG